MKRFLTTLLIGGAAVSMPLLAHAYSYNPPQYFTPTEQAQLATAGFSSPTAVGQYGSDWKYTKKVSNTCTVTLQGSQPGQPTYEAETSGPVKLYGYPLTESKSVQVAIAFAGLCQ